MQLIGFLTFVFLGCTLINRVLAGTFTSAIDASIVNSIVVFREISVLGLFTMPVPNMEYITKGLPQLVAWNYTFFGGNAAIIQYFLYTISAMLSFLAFTIVLGLVFQRFAR